MQAATLSFDDGSNAWRSTRGAASPRLAGEIDSFIDYWERTSSFTTRRELPHPDGVLIINLGPPITITGGEGSAVRIGAGQGFVAGAHLHPAYSSSCGVQSGIQAYLPLPTLRRLLGVPMPVLADRVVPLDSLLGNPAQALGQRLLAAATPEQRIALLDEALFRRLARAPVLPGADRHALALLRARPDRDIAAIAADIGWSRKHLAARVRDAVGVGPRCFRRLARFHALVRSIDQAGPASGWAELALDAGYCDQSHMIRAFREFAGMTPSEYAARRLPEIGGLPETDGPFRPIPAPGLRPSSSRRHREIRSTAMRHEIIPNLRYADAQRAIRFLCDAFGFQRHAVYADAQDETVVQHAELLWQDRMVMISSATETVFTKAAGMKTAAESGGPTIGLYLIVADVDAHAAQARAAGARIIMEPEDKSYGGRGYAALDPEGNVWSFGSYDPWPT